MSFSSKYTLALLKMSGEALQGKQGFGIDPDVVEDYADQVAEVTQCDNGVRFGVVIGGGNIFRGQALAEKGLNRATGDYMGMMATIINALAIQDAFERRGMETRVMSALTVVEAAEPYIRRRAIRHLEKGRIVIFAAGTGNPFFTTDTAAVLRASEIGAEVLLKATKVDGVYDSDPLTNPEAKYFPELTYMEAIERRLKVMDTTALSLAMENKLPIIVFNLRTRGNIRRVLAGEKVGTIVSGQWRRHMSEMIEATFQDMEDRMEKTIVAMERDLKRVRTGRASASLLDGIRVDYYGTPTPLNQMASVSVPEARLILIQPWDTSVIGSIEKAILKSELGLTPMSDGKLIRINIPPLSEERRRDLVKIVKKMAEENKVAIRNIRRDANEMLKDLKKEKEISEDEQFRAQDDVQKKTDDYIKKVDERIEAKEKEILEF